MSKKKLQKKKMHQNLKKKIKLESTIIISEMYDTKTINYDLFPPKLLSQIKITNLNDFSTNSSLWQIETENVNSFIMNNFKIPKSTK